MRFTYLLINIFTIFFPLLRSAEPELRFYKKGRYFVPAIFFTALFFLVWDYFKTRDGVWSFNERFILGPSLFGLPLEEILFFITVPYACLFIYVALSHFFSNKISEGKEKYLVWLLSVIAIVLSFFVRNKAYTFSVLVIGGLTFPLAAFWLKGNRLKIFLITYLLALIPMAIVNGLLTYLPVVIYDNSQNMGIRIGTIPIEDFLYAAILLVMNISLFEWFRGNEAEVL